MSLKIIPHLLADRDTSVAPGDDFYTHAVGTWLKNNPIPPEYSRWGSFEVVHQQTQENLRQLLEQPELFTGSHEAALASKLQQLYNAGLNEEQIEAQGLKPLQPFLDRAAGLTDITQLAGCVGFLQNSLGNPLFVFTSTPDAKNSSMVIGALGQGGLGLPDRDYYIVDDEKMNATRARYREYVEKMLALSGCSSEEAAAGTNSVMAIETGLARVSMTREDLRDPYKTYNKMSAEEVIKLSPQFDWKSFWLAGGFSITRLEPSAIDVGQPEFFSGLSSLMETVSLTAWKQYLRFHIINSGAAFLNRAIVNEQFLFDNQFLGGQREQKPRWKRVLRAVDQAMGMGLGRLYVNQHFPPSAKARAEELVQFLLDTMRQRLMNSPWMEEATKKEGLAKLQTIQVKIGYPEKWIDYTALTIVPDSYFQSMVNARHFEFQRQLAKIGWPTDTQEWLMSPHEVNAYYEQLKNEIVFPAAILQPPFFYADGDDAVNFGSIGAVIGHEITHGFDDQGRKYDQQGNIRDWWTPADEVRFQQLSAGLIEQFNIYPLPGTRHVNGAFTLGENIGDLSGLDIAYEALQKKLKDQKLIAAEVDQKSVVDQASVVPDSTLLEGLTPTQRFFFSWAQGWKNNITPQMLELQLTVDPHAPSICRCNIPLSNLEAFAEAFQVTPNQALYRSPEQRVKIW